MVKILAALAVAAISGVTGYQLAHLDPAEEAPAAYSASQPSEAGAVPRPEPMERLTQQSSTTCMTPAGQCPTYPAPIGSPCVCNGVPGTVGG